MKRTFMEVMGCCIADDFLLFFQKEIDGKTFGTKRKKMGLGMMTAWMLVEGAGGFFQAGMVTIKF